MNKHFDAYFNRLWFETDINEHLPILFTLALRCKIVVEFGVRSGNSTLAFLSALSMSSEKNYLYSYDIADCIGALESSRDYSDETTSWVFKRKDTSKLVAIPPCDLLFIDTLHTNDQVVAELEHERHVRKWIVLHDTVLFGVNGERGQPGIRAAIETFLARNPAWKVLHEYHHNNGLMILERK